MKHIFAYTEPGGSYPAYVSINEMADGRISIAARTHSQPNASIIALDRWEALNLSEALQAYLKANPK